jgi:hypothetical protein
MFLMNSECRLGILERAQSPDAEHEVIPEIKDRDAAERRNDERAEKLPDAASDSHEVNRITR